MREIVYHCFVYDVVQELGCNEEEMIRRLRFYLYIYVDNCLLRAMATCKCEIANCREDLT